MKNFRFTYHNFIFLFVIASSISALAIINIGCGHISRPAYQTGNGGYQGQSGYSAQGTNGAVDEDDESAEPTSESADETTSDGSVTETDTSKEFATPNEVLDSPDVKAHKRAGTRRGPFRLQAPVKKFVINRGFKTDDGGRDHLGLDLKGRRGDKILAAHDGVIIYAGHGFRGYGKMILLEFDQNWATLYGHLNRIRVKMGQEVCAGTQIGDMGRTGRATGVHLHFELIKNKTPIDPAPYFKPATMAKNK